MWLTPWPETGVPVEAASSAQQLFRRRGHQVGLEAKLLLQLLERRRRPESLHPDHPAGSADVALPSERGGLLDRDARRHGGRQHAVPILLRLVLEDLPRRHRDDAGADALGDQLVVGFHGKTHLAARGDEYYLGIPAWGVREPVGTA